MNLIQQKNNLFLFGKVVNTHGIKGEVRVLSKLFDSKEVSKHKTLYYFDNENNIKELEIEAFRTHKDFILLKFKDINNINDIEWLKNTQVYFKKEKLKEGEYYLSDLLNKEIYNQKNKKIGIIISIINQKFYNSLIVELVDDKKINIPIINEFNIQFDEKKNLVKVNIEDEFWNF